MTLPTVNEGKPAQQRRATDMTGEQATKLAGRIDMMEVQIRHVDEKTEKILQNLEELTKAFNSMLVLQESRAAKLELIQSRIDSLDERGEDRVQWGQDQVKAVHARVGRIEARIEDVAETCLSKHGNTSIGGTQINNEGNFLSDWSKKAWSIVGIAFALLMLIAIILFIEHNVFSKDASRLIERQIPNTEPAH